MLRTFTAWPSPVKTSDPHTVTHHVASPLLLVSIRIASPVPVTHPSSFLVVRPDGPNRSPVPVAHEPSPLSSRIPRNRRVTSSSCARAISLHAIPTSGMHSPVPVAHCTLPPIAARTGHSTFTSSSCALKPLLRTGHADPSTAPSPVPVTHYPHLPFFLTRHDPTTCHQFQLRISLPPIVTTYHRLQFTSSNYARSPDPISSSPASVACFIRLPRSPVPVAHYSPFQSSPTPLRSGSLLITSSSYAQLPLSSWRLPPGYDKWPSCGAALPTTPASEVAPARDGLDRVGEKHRHVSDTVDLDSRFWALPATFGSMRATQLSWDATARRRLC